MSLSEKALQIIDAAIYSAHPSRVIPQNIILTKNILKIQDYSFDLSHFNSIYVVGAGKASAGMAFELEKILGGLITSGLVITNYGNKTRCNRIEIVEAGHPISDQNGLLGTRRLIEKVSNLTKSDLVICLISGGASALMEYPAANISLEDIQSLNTYLLASGADINEINTIRKHLSLVKGGGLAKYIYPAQNISLIISDVIGDPLDVIASGPTFPDFSTFSDCWKIIKNYGLEDKLPVNIKTYLQNGLKGLAPERPDKEDVIFSNSKYSVLGRNRTALNAAKQKARALGFIPVVIEQPIRGEAKMAAREIINQIKKLKMDKPVALIWGGETTVTLNGDGKGGRNQEFVLAALHAIKNSFPFPFVLISCGTDGRDGPTDAAGAVITEKSFNKATKLGLEIGRFLQNNDSYTFFEKMDALIKTGPTGTNVMDVGVFLVQPMLKHKYVNGRR
jgi:glycerate 2-kinase